MATLRIGVADAAEVSYFQRKEMQRAEWKPPRPIKHIPSPDYSTPAQVNARIREFVGHNAGGNAENSWNTQWLRKAETDRSFAKLYRELRATIEPNKKLDTPRKGRVASRACQVTPTTNYDF